MLQPILLSFALATTPTTTTPTDAHTSQPESAPVAPIHVAAAPPPPPVLPTPPSSYADKLKLAQNPKTDPKMIQAIIDEIYAPFRKMRIRTAQETARYSDGIVNLAPMNDSSLQYVIDYNEELARSEVILAILKNQKIDDRNARRLFAAYNTATTADIYDLLPVSLQEQYYRYSLIYSEALAQKYGTDYAYKHQPTADELDRLLTDALAAEDVNMVNIIAVNPVTSDKTVARIAALADDSNSDLILLYENALSSLAYREKIDPKLALRFAESSNANLRAATLYRLPATVQAFYRRLGGDIDIYTYRMMFSQMAPAVLPPTPPTPPAATGATMPTGWPTNTFSGAELDRVVSTYQNRPNFWTYALVARHPNASPALLKMLSQDARPGIRASVAQNPNTPVEILQKLSKDTDEVVSAAIFYNPNVPAALSEEISQKYQCISPNTRMTVGDVLSIKQNFYCEQYLSAKTLPANTISKILGLPRTEKTWRMLQSVARGPALSQGDIEALIKVLETEHDDNEGYTLIANLLNNPNINDTQLQRLSVVAKSYSFYNLSEAIVESKLTRKQALTDAEIAISLESNNPTLRSRVVPLVPKERLQKYRDLGSDETLSYVYDNQNAPDALTPQKIDEYASEAIKNNWYWTKELIASHPRTSSKTLARLAQDNDDLSFPVDYLLAHIHKAPEMVDVLGDSNNSYARYSVVKELDPKQIALFKRLGSSEDLQYTEPNNIDKTMTANELHQLAKTKGAWTRYLVAQHPSTGIDTLRFLVNDADVTVRIALSARPEVPREILQALLKDSDAGVRSMVMSLLPSDAATRQSVLQHGTHNDIASFFAYHPDLIDEATAKILLQHPSAGIRSTVVQSINKPSPAIFKTLATDPSDLVRAAVAASANTPDDILKLLIKDSSYNVLSAIVTNPKSSLATVQAVVKTLDSMDSTGNAASAVLGAALAYNNRNPEESDAIVAFYANDSRLLIRNSIAAVLFNTPKQEKIAEQMLNDSALIVRQTVVNRLLYTFPTLAEKAARNDSVMVRRTVAASVYVLPEEYREKVKKIVEQDADPLVRSALTAIVDQPIEPIYDMVTPESLENSEGH